MYTTMSIATFGSPTLPKSDRGRYAVKDTNRVDDISGSQPKTHYSRPQREDQWTKDDISGTHSLKMHQSRSNYEDKSLMVDDIEGARPIVRKGMCLTQRHIDPLNPTYVLPSYTVPVEVMTKAHPEKEAIVTKIPKKTYSTKDILNYDDIAGSKPGWRPRHLQARHDAPAYPLMEVGDISKQNSRYVDRTSRSTNALDPVYSIHSQVIDTHFKPTPARNYIADSHLLQTRDVPGAYSGWEPRSVDRREFTNTNFVGDIEGAQADSIKHGITTNRELHPLLPYYPSLDGDVLPPCTASLLPVDKFSQPKLVQSPIKSSSKPPSARGMTKVGSSSGNLFSPVRTPRDTMAMSKSMTDLDGGIRSPIRTPSRTMDGGRDSLSLAVNLVNNSNGASPQVTGGRMSGGRGSTLSGVNSSRGPLSPSVTSKAAYQEMLSDIASVRALS